jgi:hypothetical protein
MALLAETMTPAAIIGWLRGAVMSTFQEMGSSMSAEFVYRRANAFFGSIAPGSISERRFLPYLAIKIS